MKKLLKQQSVLNLAIITIVAVAVVIFPRAETAVRLQPTSQEIYNIQAKLAKETCNGLTHTKVVLQKLKALDWLFKFKQNLEGFLTDLIYILKVSMQFLRLFSKVLIMDCTYKTNRYKLLLLDIIGYTNINSIFYGAFSLLNTEDERFYQWTLWSFCKLLYQDSTTPNTSTTTVFKPFSSQKLKVVDTDCELALMNAINSEMLGAANIIYIWYLNKVIEGWPKKIYPMLKGWLAENDDKVNRIQILGNSKLDAWKALVASKTIELYESQSMQDNLGTLFSEDSGLIFIGGDL